MALVIAGSGEDEDKFKFQVSSFQPKAGQPLADKFQERVIFLGHIDHDSLPRVLKAADVFVRPSRSEGLGNAFLEAMAVGLPVVGAKVGGIVDFIKDRATGLLAAPDNAPELSQAINELRQDANLRHSLSRAGQSLAKTKYDWNIIAQAYKNIYESC